MWWLLITAEGPPRADYAFNHVGIEGALGQEGGAFDLAGFAVEDVDEHAADGLALGFGIGNASQFSKEFLSRINVDQRNVVVISKETNDLVRLVQTQEETGVDKDAGELVADRRLRGSAPPRPMSRRRRRDH